MELILIVELLKKLLRCWWIKEIDLLLISMWLKDLIIKVYLGVSLMIVILLMFLVEILNLCDDIFFVMFFSWVDLIFELFVVLEWWEFKILIFINVKGFNFYWGLVFLLGRNKFRCRVVNLEIIVV